MWTQEKVKARFDNMRYKCMYTKQEIKTLHSILQPNEEIVTAVEGELKKIHNRNHTGWGIVVLTDIRLIFYRKSLIGTVTLEEFPISKISSSSYRKGIMQASFLVNTSHNNAEFECFEKITTEELNRLLQERIHGTVQKSSAPSQGTHTNIDVVAQLEKLFELKQKGALTDEEYAQQKNKLLQV